MNGSSGLRRPPANPADAQFWFGDPMSEAELPPLEQPRNGHPVQPPPLPGDLPPAARRGPAEVGPPSVFFTPAEPDPQWPTPADSPSLRFQPLQPARQVGPDISRQTTEPVSRRDLRPILNPDTETTAIIPQVPPPPPEARNGEATAYTPRKALFDDEPNAPRTDEPRAGEATAYAPRKALFEDEPTRGQRAEKPAEPEESDDSEDSGDEPKHGKHRRQSRQQPLWRELLTLIGVALVLTFVIQHFVGRVYSIPSGSMEQTLHGCPGCTGDRVFVDKMVYDFRDPLPGDVVVFQGPNSWTGQEVNIDGSGNNPVLKGLQYMGSLVGIAPPDERDFVKRVIAIGGQTVECCDAEHRVLVDGKPLDEPYVYWESGGPDERQRFAPVTVPEGTLWVMGDNRGNSADSRIQGGGGIRGVVPITKVIGKVRAIVLPPSRWQGVGDHNPQSPPAIAAPAWQQGLPAGIGVAAAWPVLWFGRRVKKSLISRKAD